VSFFNLKRDPDDSITR